ncbi:MAG: 3-oxoacyl-ACP reductase FabG [Bryobacterales bacterium]|nr:3-oxoacyl-ACP reductase FabG [Bryobacterales bacterium]
MPTFPKEHVALVTGASLGIGAATAVELGRQGARVAVHYNSSREEAERVANQIADLGGEAKLFQADVSKPEEAKALAGKVLSAFGRIDSLVNNAGSLVDRKGFFEIDDAFWHKVMDINLTSVLWVSQPVAKHMAERGSGAIVNLGSIAGHNGGGPGAIAYATSKAAITCLTKGMAKELIKSGIRVNAVNPGVILTPFHERFSSQERMNAMVAQIPQGRAGTPDECAGVIAFLASPTAAHIVGESIEVNGGMLMD